MALSASALVAALCALPAPQALAKAAAQSKCQGDSQEHCTAQVGRAQSMSSKAGIGARGQTWPQGRWREAACESGRGRRVRWPPLPARPSFGQVYGLHSTDDRPGPEVQRGPGGGPGHRTRCLL